MCVCVFFIRACGVDSKERTEAEKEEDGRS